jgi:hypothetical protein
MKIWESDTIGNFIICSMRLTLQYDDEIVWGWMMSWVGHVASTGEIKITYKSLVEKKWEEKS